LLAPNLVTSTNAQGPRREVDARRLDPRNGLCLSALHDAAFDSGLITLDEKCRVVLSARLKSHFPQPALEQNFVPYAGQPIQMPDKLAEPAAEFLEYHWQEIFTK
jgi:putative restriction endonuclease